MYTPGSVNCHAAEGTVGAQGFQQLDEIKAILADAKVRPSSRKREDDLVLAPTDDSDISAT